MVNLREAVREQIQLGFCRGLNGASDFYGLISATGLPTGLAEQLIARAQGMACGEGSPDTSSYAIPPQFNNGQCPLPYQVQWTNLTRRRGSQQPVPGNSFTRTVTGPISRIELRDAHGFSGAACAIVGPDGDLFYTELSPSVAAGFEWYEIVNVVVTPLGGNPDDCGGPEGTPPDPVEESTEMVPLVFDDNQGNQVDAGQQQLKFSRPCIGTRGIFFAAQMDTPFGPVCAYAGVEVEPEDLLIGDSPLSPEVRFIPCPDEACERNKEGAGDDLRNEFEFGAPTGFTTTVPDADLVASNTQEADDDSPGVVGALVTSGRVNPGVTINATVIIPEGYETFPTLLVPYIGWARFKIAIPTSGGGYAYGYTADIPIKQVQQVVTNNTGFKGVGVEVRWNRGWQGFFEEILGEVLVRVDDSEGPEECDATISLCDYIDTNL